MVQVYAWRAACALSPQPACPARASAWVEALLTDILDPFVPPPPRARLVAIQKLRFWKDRVQAELGPEKQQVCGSVASFAGQGSTVGSKVDSMVAKVSLFGVVRLGLSWFGLAWRGLAWLGLAWFGLDLFCLVWFRMVWSEEVAPDRTNTNQTKPN
eukprot:gene23590-biopygen13381